MPPEEKHRVGLQKDRLRNSGNPTALLLNLHEMSTVTSDISSGLTVTWGLIMYLPWCKASVNLFSLKTKENVEKENP